MINIKNIPVKINSIDAEYVSLNRGKRLVASNDCGFIVCRKGTLTLMDEQNEFNLRPSEIYFARPLRKQTYVKSTEDVDVLDITVPQSTILSHIQDVKGAERLIFTTEEPIIKLNDRRMRILNYSVGIIQEELEQVTGERMKQEERASSLAYIESVGKHSCHRLLQIFVSHNLEDGTEIGRQDQIFRNFIINLLNNYRKQRDIAFYADLQDVTACYLSSTVKKISGGNPTEWVSRFVIAESKRMLETTDMTCKEIAANLNFANQSFFGKYFKQHVGVSPQDYVSFDFLCNG